MEKGRARSENLVNIYVVSAGKEQRRVQFTVKVVRHEYITNSVKLKRNLLLTLASGAGDVLF